MSAESIHICYALNDKTGRYSKYAGTSICSIFQNTQSHIVIHLLHDHSLSSQNQEKFLALTKSYHQDIIFHNISPQRLHPYEKYLHPLWLEAFTPADLYRLFIWDILPTDIERIIYLDADTIIHLDIAKLWQEPTGSNGLAAVVDEVVKNIPEKAPSANIGLDANTYFNAGVLLMDRKPFSYPDWNQKIETCLKNYPNLCYPDQDILNYYYGNSYHILPECYNCIASYQIFKKNMEISPCIYHYAGRTLSLDFSDPYAELFFHYFTSTPWCNTEFLRRMWSVATQIYDIRTESLRQITLGLIERKRIVVGSASDKAVLSRILNLNPSEPYIIYEPGDTFTLPESLSAEHSFLFIIFADDYPELAEKLCRSGYKENADYIDGKEWLTSKEGGQLLDGHHIFSQL